MARLTNRDLDHVIEHSGGAFPELRDSRIFIAGGTGFVGKWLLENPTLERRQSAMFPQSTELRTNWTSGNESAWCRPSNRLNEWLTTARPL